MTGDTITTSTESISHHTGSISAYLATPSRPGEYPVILVFQEIFGVNEHIRHVTKRIAAEGFIAIAPHLFQRTAPNFAIGYSPAEIMEGRLHKEQTTGAQLISDIQATIRYAHTLPFVNPKAVGCIGFCFGGHVAYLAAALPEIEVTASFYGAGIPTTTPGGGLPTLECTPNIHGTIYTFFGTQDPLIPVTQIDLIERTLSTHHVNHQVFRYPTGHGFFCDQRSDYHREAAAHAWEQVKTLFNTLKTPDSI